MLSEVNQAKSAVLKAANRKRKSQFGQFFTPTNIAEFMASLFAESPGGDCRLLDAGAGVGSLSAAFLDRWASGGLKFDRVEVDAFEIDDSLHPQLAETLENYSRVHPVESTIRSDDFIHTAVDATNGSLFSRTLPKYTHAILNPPYKKIRSDSAHRSALRQVGIETVNLYTAFVALAVSLLADGGQLVAIIPRSFCNGPYYRPFREYLLKRTAIRHIHLFASRKKAFQDDAVLQENVIILLERRSSQENVTVTTSSDSTFSDLEKHDYAFARIVSPTDSERFIHIPTSPDHDALDGSNAIRAELDQIGVKVSTGPIVDFRLKEFLSDLPESGTAPLLYPCHLNGSTTNWPQPDSKKPNAIHRNSKTEKWLYPNGFYCVVRRFSSKEERRRIIASVIRPKDFPTAEVLGFENHLNVFHEEKHGLPEALAYGLAAYLNTTAVDANFRRFNGHTQVNATDLRLMKYPSRGDLIALGQWAMECRELTQAMLDEQLEAMNV